MAMEWKDSYACHIPEIDQQHQRLFEIGNQLYTLALLQDDGKSIEKVQAILSELQAYTIYHFQFEEALQARYHYPSLEMHHEEHQSFINTLSEMEIKAIQEDSKDLVLKLIMFVSEWISNHIMISDKKYSKHIHDQMKLDEDVEGTVK
jgi:hemerythrin